MSRALTATVLFQSYIALGVEPGASWDEIAARHKDLVMAWHPDRFPDEKQKAKAESELKKINAARDTLRKHFQSEHRAGPSCTCKPQPKIEEMSDRAAAPRTEKRAPETAAGNPLPASHLLAILKSPFAATLLLICASLGTIALYHESTKARPFQSERIDSPASFKQSAPPLQEETAASPARPAADSSASRDNFDPAGATGNQEGKYSTDGTFYSSFLARQEKRKQIEAAARRSQLEKELFRLREARLTAANQLAECEKKLASVGKEVSEQQSVLSEMAGVASDLETANGSLPADSSQLYYSNPDYRKRADVLINLEKQRANLTDAEARLRLQIEQNKTREAQITLELSQQ